MVSTNKVCRCNKRKPSQNFFVDNAYFSDIQINR